MDNDLQQTNVDAPENPVQVEDNSDAEVAVVDFQKVFDFHIVSQCLVRIPSTGHAVRRPIIETGPSEPEEMDTGLTLMLPYSYSLQNHLQLQQELLPLPMQEEGPQQPDKLAANGLP